MKNLIQSKMKQKISLDLKMDYQSRKEITYDDYDSQDNAEGTPQSSGPGLSKNPLLKLMNKAAL